MKKLGGVLYPFRGELLSAQEIAIVEGISFVAVYKWIKKDPLGPEHSSYKYQGRCSFLKDKKLLSDAHRTLRKYKAMERKISLQQRHEKATERRARLASLRALTAQNTFECLAMHQAVANIRGLINNPLGNTIRNKLERRAA